MKSAALATLIAVLLVPGSVAARMYQWVSPGTGTVQASGTPPPWYRNQESGPRTLVYDKGRLVDDTAIAVPSESAEVLREAAFREYEQRQRAEALKKLERAAAIEARRRRDTERLAAEKRAEETAAAEGDARSASPAQAGVEVPAVDQSVIDQLKALVGEFDKQSAGGGTGTGAPP